MIPVLILAAGQSRRMRGTDKLMQVVEGKPLLTLQIQRATPVGQVYVAIPEHNHPRRAAILGTTAITLAVRESEEGIGGTIRGAIAQLPSGPFMLILPDLVSLETSDLQTIVNAMHEYPNNLIWRGATPDGKAGHPVIFCEKTRQDLATLKGDKGSETVLKPLKSQTYLHRFIDNRARYDLDTPEDWAAWQNLTK